MAYFDKRELTTAESFLDYFRKLNPSFNVRIYQLNSLEGISKLYGFDSDNSFIATIVDIEWAKYREALENLSKLGD